MKIGIMGCAGRMGRTLVRKVIQHPDLTLAGGTEHNKSEALGSDLGVLAGCSPADMMATADTEHVIQASDAIIDFTAPDATMAHAALAAQHKTAHIIGTTGLTEEQEKQLAAYAKDTVILHSHNMSIGVNILLGLVEQAARALPPEIWDAEILEMHHRHKVDAPSGTAISLGRAAQQGRSASGYKAPFKLSREGRDDPRSQGEIGFATLRGGSVIGEHSAIFASEEERVILSHKAETRDVFAAGALRAALWSRNQKPCKVYTMQDVLGLK